MYSSGSRDGPRRSAHSRLGTSGRREDRLRQVGQPRRRQQEVSDDEERRYARGERGQRREIDDSSSSLSYLVLNVDYMADDPFLDPMSKDTQRADLSRTLTKDGRPIFTGSDYTQMEARELKKIQIDIQRSLPNARSPAQQHKHVDHALDRVQHLVLVRRKDEGRRGLFDRDDIKAAREGKSNSRRADQRPVMKNDSIQSRLTLKRGSHASSHLDTKRSRRQSSHEDLEQESERRGTLRSDHGKPSGSVRDRLGPLRKTPKDQEQQRELDPGFVPKGKAYFEHDDRDADEDADSDPRSDRHDYRDRRHYQRPLEVKNRRSNWNGSYQRRLGRRGSPKWQHDRFED